MDRLAAFLRADIKVATSYRVGTVLAVGSIVATAVPVYFVAGAIQPVIADSIQDQGRDYFAFLIVGMIAFWFVSVAVDAIPRAISSGIASGRLEALLATPTSLPTLLAGMTTYGFLWATLRTCTVLVTAVLLGANFVDAHVGLSLLILVAIILAYLPIGLIGAALILAFRTMGPLTKVVLVASTLLGGMYYPTTVIPSWIESLSVGIPLTYGLRALRRTFLDGSTFGTVAPDLVVLLGFIAVLFALGTLSLRWALQYARRAGTLSQY